MARFLAQSWTAHAQSMPSSDLVEIACYRVNGDSKDSLSVAGHPDDNTTSNKPRGQGGSSSSSSNNSGASNNNNNSSSASSSSNNANNSTGLSRAQ